jgi:hypothetical protein
MKGSLRRVGTDPRTENMATRHTRRDAELAFSLLCDALGKRKATDYRDKGAWTLDYAACYGGYVVHELLPSGGITEPFGSTRVSAREFCGRVNFLVRALDSREVA